MDTEDQVLKVSNLEVLEMRGLKEQSLVLLLYFHKYGQAIVFTGNKILIP